MEMGSFIELQLPTGCEYYAGKTDVARLNTGRAAIWHAFRLTGCRALWLPYYQCDTVRDFLRRKGVPLRFYHIGSDFTPLDIAQEPDEAVLLVNYFGVMSHERMSWLAGRCHHAIIDNSQAFFCAPLAGGQNVYSCRKFVGVPDGAYVLGPHAERYTDEYEQCFSSGTAGFLLQRIEYGCEGKAYESRMANEYRIDTEDCLRMSKLTHALLDGVDYEQVKLRRRANFATACELFDRLNQLEAQRYCDEATVPTVYPLVVEDDTLLDRLLAAKHFQGHWWSYLLDEMPTDSFEYWLSRYVVPITIDQRYDRADLERIQGVVAAS